MNVEYSFPKIELINAENEDVICTSLNFEGWYTPDTNLGGDTTPGKDGW